MRKNWSIEEDIVAFYLFKFGEGSEPYDLKEISDKLGRDIGSFKMRIMNFKAICGEGGLTNYAKQSLDIYNKYKDLPKEDYYALILEILK